MKRILISRLSALGDLVCSLPAAAALKRTFPESHITWVADPRFGAVAECCEAVDEVIKVKPGFRPATWPRFEVEFDLALDLQGLVKSALVLGRARAKEKLGYHWQREGAWLFSRPILPDPSSTHIVDQYVDVARAAGGEAGRAEFRLVPPPDALASVRAKVARPDYVVINAGAGWATKRYPGTQFAQVIDALASNGLHAVLVGGKADADRAAAEETMRACHSEPQSLLGQTSIPELIALISGARAHVGGDTGSTHIAAALGVPAVGLYSITRPERSCPYGQRHNCLYDPRGLRHISADAVVDKVKSVLK